MGEEVIQKTIGEGGGRQRGDPREGGVGVRNRKRPRDRLWQEDAVATP